MQKKPVSQKLKDSDLKKPKEFVMRKKRDSDTRRPKD